MNVGCIPSKALLDSSHLYDQTRHGLQKHGIKVKGTELDLAAMMKRKDEIVQKMTAGINSLFRARKIDAIKGFGRILSPQTVEARDGDDSRILNTKRILIATGSAPIEIPNLPFDGERVISSDQALSLTEVPSKLAVIGAGAIGLEMASVWNRLGSDVEIIEKQNSILPGMDRESTRALHRILEKQGLTFYLKAGANKVEMKRTKAHLTIETGEGEQKIICDKVLVAVGRRPNTEGLNLDAIGLATDERGRIAVNETYETGVQGVYAIGDVIKGPMLAHKAEEEGVAAVEIMSGMPGHVNYEAIPNVVYTYPELASVGITSEQAKENGLEIVVGKFPFAANGRAQCMEDVDGFVKIIADAKTDRVLGAHILSGRASDLIAECAIAIEFRGSAEDIARSVHAHPTLPEAIKEAALAAHKRPIHIAK